MVDGKIEVVGELVRMTLNRDSWTRNFRRYWAFESVRNRYLILRYGLSQIVNTLLDLAILAFIMPLVSLMSSGGDAQIFSKSWLSSFTGDGSTRDSIIKIFLLILVGYTLKSIVQILTKYRAKVIRLKLSIEMSDRLFRSYLDEEYEWHTRMPSPLLVRNVNEAFLVIDHQVTPLIVVASESILVASIVILFFFVQPVATLCAGILVAAASFAIFRILSAKVQQLGVERLEQDSLRVTLLTQSFTGIRDVKLLSLENRLITEVSSRNTRALGAANTSVLVGEVTPILLELTVMASISILVVVGVVLGLETSKLLPLLAFFSVGAIRMIPSFARISSAFQLLRYSATRVSTILDSLENSAQSQTKTSLIEDWNGTGEEQQAITLRDISFKYRAANSGALSNVTFSLPQGSILGITGVSGSGKTTLLDIAMGLLHPDTGSIEIMGTPLGARQRDDFAYVSQDVFLFSGSLKENILMGTSAEKVSAERMQEILDFADATDFVESMENGLETLLGERGVNLSGGQRQRIGLARAIAQDPKLLVLDEATSSLDEFSQTKILSNLRSLGISIIMISHSVTSLENCDRLLLLERGRIIADGSPSEVLLRYQEIHQQEPLD
jgi:ABC-type bacteriocin/lantibiotic exporter with double-glycine peptidase domain